MALRNLLHKNKLDDFIEWLDYVGLPNKKSIAKYQVWGIDIDPPSGNWQYIYEPIKSKEHYSVPWPLVPIVQQFIEDTKNVA